MKIAIAISGASGSIYADLLLSYLYTHRKRLELDLQLILSSNAETVWREELNNDNLEKYKQVFNHYSKQDFYAPLASGSSRTEALVICPCSMGTLGRIHAGVSDDLITRGADVMLKEQKKLILVPRETPYNTIHLRNMYELSQAGAHIIPASPSFYSKPSTIDELCMTLVYRVLQSLGIQTDSYTWPNT